MSFGCVSKRPYDSFSCFRHFFFSCPLTFHFSLLPMWYTSFLLANAKLSSHKIPHALSHVIITHDSMGLQTARWAASSLCRLSNGYFCIYLPLKYFMSSVSCVDVSVKKKRKKKDFLLSMFLFSFTTNTWPQTANVASKLRWLSYFTCCWWMERIIVHVSLFQSD